MTGYHSCLTPITGRNLQIIFANRESKSHIIEIAGLNIYSSKNLVTSMDSILTVVREKPRAAIQNFFEGDFDRHDVPRDISKKDKCLYYTDY